jgi:putative two-component system response regulator
VEADVSLETLERLIGLANEHLDHEGKDVSSVAGSPAESAPALASDDGVRDATILIVDDEPQTIQSIRNHLREAGWRRFLATTHANEVASVLRDCRPEIVLLDATMPQASGLDVLQEIRAVAELNSLPVILMAAATDHRFKRRALELGITDFLAKPIDGVDLVIRVRNVLTSRASQQRLHGHAQKLEASVIRRTEELIFSRIELLRCLARAAEYRDHATAKHVIRVGNFVGIIARRLGFDRRATELIEQAAHLHDVGKIGIPDSVLHKSGKLDLSEYEVMKRHAVIGRRILEGIVVESGVQTGIPDNPGRRALDGACSPLLAKAATIALSHHEKWDGSGYPHGLAGHEIPIEGRITAVADVFDALASRRPYKDAYDFESCLSIMISERGRHFDPTVLDAFLSSVDDVRHVLHDMADPG